MRMPHSSLSKRRGSLRCRAVKKKKKMQSDLASVDPAGCLVRFVDPRSTHRWKPSMALSRRLQGAASIEG